MGGLTLTMLEAVRRRGIPAVAFVHDDWLDYGPRVDPWLRTFTGPGAAGSRAPVAERLAGIPTRVDFGGAATYVFVSEFTRRRALGLGLGLERTAVAHSGIHTDFLDPAPPQRVALAAALRRPARPAQGRRHRRRGAGAPARPRPSSSSSAAGTRARRTGCARSPRERGVAERVRFAGQQGRAELVDAYARADVAVFPVVWDEPWGLVPLEAMAHRAARRRDRARRLGRVPARRRELPAVRGGRRATRSPRRSQRLAGNAVLRARLREGGLATAPRHTEAVLNEAVERELATVVEQSGAAVA